MDKTIICPGCGWTGTIAMLGHWGDCPECDYENNLEPNRLCTLSEMLKGNGIYDGVLMGPFLKSLFKFLGYPDNQNEWPDYDVVHWSAIDGGKNMVKNVDEAFGLLMDAITNKGVLDSNHLRAWAQHVRREQGYQSMLTMWLWKLAVILDELGTTE